MGQVTPSPTPLPAPPPAPRETRLAAGLTLERAAVRAGVSPPTLRAFERGGEALSAATRQRLTSYYQRFAAQLEAVADAASPEA